MAAGELPHIVFYFQVPKSHLLYQKKKKALGSNILFMLVQRINHCLRFHSEMEYNVNDRTFPTIHQSAQHLKQTNT